MYRTHDCGQLRLTNVGEVVTICGWVDRIRDHKNATFIVLRDRYGTTQVVVDQTASESIKTVVKQLASEYVIQVVGQVCQRAEGQANAKLSTGEI